MAVMWSTLVIARLTFREAKRRWVLWVALALGLLFLAIYGIGFFEIEKDIQRSAGMEGRMMATETHNFLIIMGLYVVNFLTLIMTVLTSVDTLSGEIASGTIHTLVSKPVQRRDILLGKWLGFMCMLTLYLLLMAGGVCLVGYIVADYLPPNVLRGLALMWLNIPLLLGISLLGGASLSTLANGVVAFGLYGVAFIGGWIEQVGAFLNNQVAVNIGILCSLIIPSEAIWRRAAYEMQTPLSGVLGFSFFTSSSVPSPFMVGYAVFYALSALFLALRAFQHRDL
jgi:ABC-type transport system involved in multi-copper enzyme maturation permease subunit